MKQVSGMQAAHPAARAYALRHGLSETDFRSDGRMALRFDDRWRVQVRPASLGRMVMTASLVDLDTLMPPGVSALLVQLASAATALAREHAAGLCIDSVGQQLMLQQWLAAGTTVDQLETEVAGFVNALTFWGPASTRQAGLMAHRKE